MSLKRRFDDLRRRAAGAAANVAAAATGRALGSRIEDEPPAVTVAAFGKHPGWDDHLEGLGLNTAALVEFNRFFYTDGIRTLFDTGAWEDAGAGALIESFNHRFIGRRGGDVIVGRMTPSRDGKGRSRYPFILCIHAHGLPDKRIFDTLPGVLEDLERRCAEAASAAEVRAIVESAQSELEGRAPSAAGRASETSGDRLRDERATRALARLADRFGDDRTGLHRCLYVIEREMSAYMPLPSGSSSTSSRDTQLRPRHVRVPVHGESENGAPHESSAAAMRDWMDSLFGVLAPSTPLLLLAPAERDWLDIIVGDATDHQLKCLRLGPTAIPLASSVPYELDAAFVERAERLIAASREEKRPDDGASGPGSMTTSDAGGGRKRASPESPARAGTGAAPQDRSFRLASPL